MPFANTRALMGDVSRRPVREVIAGKLAALISSGVLAPGDELPGERELAASLCVSRETVRGAIGILAAHDILHVNHGARTTVATGDVGALAADGPKPEVAESRDLASVHEARLLVEQRIARNAATAVTQTLLDDLAASIDTQETSAADPVRFLLCDREFHALFYRAGGNDVLFDMAMALYNHLLEHRRRIVAQSESVAQSIADHRAILAALRSGNATQAAAAVTTHATRIYETTSEFLRERGGSDDPA